MKSKTVRLAQHTYEKMVTIPNAGEVSEKPELSGVAGGNVERDSHSGKQFHSLLHMTHTFA